MASITVPVMEMAALNENTIWTWNAIGKRKGAWALDEDAPEATKGFLLNHLIHELLPPKGDGLRWANSDPITGQAAWFDLKVAIEEGRRPRGRPSPPRDAAAEIPRRQGPGRTRMEGRPHDRLSFLALNTPGELFATGTKGAGPHGTSQPRSRPHDRPCPPPPHENSASSSTWTPASVAMPA